MHFQMFLASLMNLLQWSVYEWTSLWNFYEVSFPWERIFLFLLQIYLIILLAIFVISIFTTVFVPECVCCAKKDGRRNDD